jgi:hypothetical protein
MRDLQNIPWTRAGARKAFPQIFQSQFHLFVHGGGEDAARIYAGLTCDGDDFAGLRGGEGCDVGVGWFWRAMLGGLIFWIVLGWDIVAGYFLVIPL